MKLLANFVVFCAALLVGRALTDSHYPGQGDGFFWGGIVMLVADRLADVVTGGR